MEIATRPQSFDRSLATTLAAKAAIAWYGGASRADALRVVMSAMSAAMRAGSTAVRKPQDFVELLRTPLASWLPGADDVQLVEEDRPSAYCLDLEAEGGHEPAAELAQARVGDSRATFARRDDGEREYRAFRNFLATHGHAKRFDAQRAIAASGIDLADLYEDIPTECRLALGGEEYFVACHRCTWPMRVSATLVECASAECRADGARFHRTDTGLVPLGARLPQAPLPANDRVRLRRGVWRYTLVPGLAELDLRNRLEEVEGTVVVLWPQRDRYDLFVRHGSNEWRVDVKDWSSPLALARALVRKPPSEKTWIVVPDHRRRDVGILKAHAADPLYRFATLQQFVDEVRNAAKGSQS